MSNSYYKKAIIMRDDWAICKVTHRQVRGELSIVIAPLVRTKRVCWSWKGALAAGMRFVLRGSPPKAVDDDGEIVVAMSRSP